MPKSLRKESITGIYHVMAKGINNESIFSGFEERYYLKKIIKEILDTYTVEIYSYCFMSNHLHLIIKADIKMLSAFMAKVLAKYAGYYNYKHNRNGHVFQNRFKSECIEDESYFWTCLQYIHLNPVKANMVKDITEYKYSSAYECINGCTELLHDKAVKLYNNRFKTKQKFIQFHKEKTRTIILDTPEEMELQYRDVALEILNEMKTSYSIDTSLRIIQEIDFRKEYKQRLRETLDISVKKVDQIFQGIKMLCKIQ